MNTGSDCGTNIAGIAAEPAPHFAYAFFHNPLERPSPAGMERAHRAPLSIDEDYGKTVGGLHREQDSGSRCDQPVAS